MSDFAPTDCPFCHLPPERILAGNTRALAIADAYPVSPGHTLIILRRHTPSLFGLTAEEVADLYDLLQNMKARLDYVRPGKGNYG
jgi:diadenosine tetraphosphate (Ap4A) HIT family hydrolase